MDVNLLFESPVFICGASRSGTTLLVNLLDGHPNLMVYPIDLQLLDHFRKKDTLPPDYFKTDFLNQQHMCLYCDQVALSKFNNKVFQEFGPCREFNFGNHDFKKFKSVYVESLKNPSSLKDIISSWAKAFYYSNTPFWPDYEPQYFVDKRTLANEICTSQLFKEFPRAKFIHLIRHPKGRYASAKIHSIIPFLPTRVMKRIFNTRDSFIVRLLEKLGLKYLHYQEDIDFVTAVCASSILSMKLALENEKKIGKDNYLVIKYENLVRDRRQTMEEIRGFLKIKESPFLFEQTQYRLPKEAQSSFAEVRSKIEGVDPIERAERNFERITSFSERKLFNFYLNNDIVAQFGYHFPSVKKEEVLRTIWMPFKYERVRDYICKRPQLVKIINNLHKKPLDVIWLEKWKNGEGIQC